MNSEQLAIDVAEHNSASVWNAWDQATAQLDAAIAEPLRLVPIKETEEQRNERLMRSPLVLSLANAAERRCAEAERVRAGLRPSSLNDWARARALVDVAYRNEVAAGVHS